jgi:ABC-type cobalamin/Fe3+-siderophores transport system ATPase subunit
MSIAVSGRSLGVRYGERRVFDGVYLDLTAGKLIVIVGPNGSGKSSLLRALAGIQKPTHGTVRRAAPTLLIGSQAAPPPDVTPRDLAGYGLALRRPWYRLAPSLEEDEAVDAALARTGLTDRARDAIGEMSAGEVQRAWIAAALATKVGALLVDEPTSHLDLRFQIDVLNTLRALTTDGVAVAAAVHDLSLAARFGDVVCVLAGGTMIAGFPESVLTPEILSRAYDVEVNVHRHPTWGFLLCTPSSDVRSRP